MLEAYEALSSQNFYPVTTVSYNLVLSYSSFEVILTHIRRYANSQWYLFHRLTSAISKELKVCLHSYIQKREKQCVLSFSKKQMFPAVFFVLLYINEIILPEQSSSLRNAFMPYIFGNFPNLIAFHAQFDNTCQIQANLLLILLHQHIYQSKTFNTKTKLGSFMTTVH